MNLDDPVCLCFHVSRRKIIRYIKIEKPRRPSQLSECFGAGTGCGWCRPYLERLHAQHGESVPSTSDSHSSDAPTAADLDSITAQEYQKARENYRKQREEQDRS
ncbi:MAG: (2Fe-2S)-binding protein [Planctomycetota bacterium]